MKRTLAAIAAATLLAACSSQADPPPPAPTSAKPSATASAPTPPPLPKAAEKDGKAGAEAFVRYYFAVASYAQITGNTSELRRIQLPDCRACTGGVSWIERVYRRGGRIVGGRHTVQKAHAIPVPGQKATWIVNTTVHGASSRVLNTSGRQKHYPAETFDARFVVSFGLFWRVESWEDV